MRPHGVSVWPLAAAALDAGGVVVETLVDPTGRAELVAAAEDPLDPHPTSKTAAISDRPMPSTRRWTRVIQASLVVLVMGRV
jgi:hypothetical protein